MNQPESDLEQLLENATPLPCSVDPLQLMFAAGAEQQKQQSATNSTVLILASCLSVLFLLSTVFLVTWNFRLVDENSKLIAAIESADPRTVDANKDDSALGTNRKSGTKKRNGVIRESGQTNSGPEQGKSKNDQQEAHRMQQTGFLLTDHELPSVRESNDKRFLLRGVALLPEDEYRLPIRVTRPGIGSGNQSLSPASTGTNLDLRQRMELDLMGL